MKHIDGTFHNKWGAKVKKWRVYQDYQRNHLKGEDFLEYFIKRKLSASAKILCIVSLWVLFLCFGCNLYVLLGFFTVTLVIVGLYMVTWIISKLIEFWRRN